MRTVMLGRQLVMHSAFLRRSLCSNVNKLTILEVGDKTGIAQLTLNRPPVNSLNLELLRDISEDIKLVEKNRSRGLILTSSSKSVFSAGLDIHEMYQPDPERLKQFWTTLQNTWLALYGCTVPTAAAINGHSPAGGCLLATACEYRVMLPNFTIGLNETKLGICAPPWFMSTFVNVLPRHAAEMALTQGKMFTTEEAEKCGLIDTTAPTKEEAVQKCADFIASFALVNPIARAMTKRQFRLNDMVQLEQNRKQDLDTFVNFALRPEVQKSLGVYLDALKKKSKN